MLVIGLLALLFVVAFGAGFLVGRFHWPRYETEKVLGHVSAVALREQNEAANDPERRRKWMNVEAQINYLLESMSDRSAE